MKNFYTLVLLVLLPVFLSQANGQWASRDIIDKNLDHPASFESGDIDGDGDEDIIATIFYDRDLVWYENDYPVWTKHVISSNIGGVGVSIADIDGDKKLDVTLAANTSDEVKWYKNKGGSPITWSIYVIDNDLDGAEFVDVDDIDSDGDPDVVATGWKSDKVVWYENGGGEPITWTKFTIDTSLNGATLCHAVDIDGDDTLDVLANGIYDNDVVWYKNENAGQSWTKYIIDGDLGRANEVAHADLDGDEDEDVVATGNSADSVVWYENGGGTPVNWTKHTIDPSLDGAFGVNIADIDTNGTVDVIATGNMAGNVVWYENDGGSPIIWHKRPIDQDLSKASDVIICDIDGNKLPDIVVNQYLTDGSIVWYKHIHNNPSGIEYVPDIKSISAYPNPANNLLTVETNAAGQHTVEIHSLNGQLIYSTEMEGPTHQIDLSSFQKGLYFITVRSRDYTITDKVIKL